MTDCPVCQRETPPIKIGGQIYCSVCGTATGATVAPRRLSLDLSPRAHAAVARPAAPAPQPHGTSAAALHGRVKPSQVLDLRHAAPMKPAVHHAAHDVPAAAPLSTTHERQLAHLNERLAKAKQVERSAHIGKFRTDHVTEPAPKPALLIPTTPLPAHVETQHAAMANLPRAQVEPAAPRVAGKPRRHLHLTPQHGRALATVSAVALMSGYIWLQNYPKLALQNASNQAGLTATLPSYLPSSYSLNGTDTRPGLVTLSFKSPSATEPLKIAQHATTWDSSSLLDNFVARHTDDYSTVQSQGLTIFLFNNNQAAWVNHGIWYSIEGASRLSREQILKIAYSL
jgi:hypothetical protein